MTNKRVLVRVARVDAKLEPQIGLESDTDTGHEDVENTDTGISVVSRASPRV